MTFISHSSGAGRSKVKLQADLMLQVEGLLPGSQKPLGGLFNEGTSLSFMASHLQVPSGGDGSEVKVWIWGTRHLVCRRPTFKYDFNTLWNSVWNYCRKTLRFLKIDRHPSCQYQPTDFLSICSLDRDQRRVGNWTHSRGHHGSYNSLFTWEPHGFAPRLFWMTNSCDGH